MTLEKECEAFVRKHRTSLWNQFLVRMARGESANQAWEGTLQAMFDAVNVAIPRHRDPDGCCFGFTQDALIWYFERQLIQTIRGIKI
jgi:hypothetical protein